jgi:succinate dehydrogenase / fumarate reductase cytochrome b subunit
MSSAETKANRPLSPHLQIYRWPLTMAVSIAQRITGGALYFGTLLVVWWLVAAASGPKAYAVFSAVAGSWFGLLVLFGYTWALLQHMLGGLRHFLWDFGIGLGRPARDRLALANVVVAAGLAVVLWLIVWVTA